ncbi:hypothetical protein ABPG74_019049 [Tetrahymena malaccensis]
MSNQLAAINQDNKAQAGYEYKQTPNAEDTQYSNDDQNKFPSPVLIAMSALTENLDQHKEMFQHDFIREDTFDLGIQCGKLNSQYISGGTNKASDQFSSQDTSSESHNNEDLEQQQVAQTQKKYKQQMQKTQNIEEIYCNGQIEKIGYYRLLQIKNNLQNMMKFNFPEHTFQLVHDSNPLDRNFFKNQILNTLIHLNEKVPPRVIEKSKPIICCQKLLASIRIYGLCCIMSALISLVLMISNFLCYKSQLGFSLLFIIASVVSISTILSYYFFFRQLTTFNHKNFLQWTLFFSGISGAYFFIFVSGFVVGNTQGVQFTSILLCLTHLLFSFLTKEVLYKFIRFLVLLRAIPETELQVRFSYFY